MLLLWFTMVFIFIVFSSWLLNTLLILEIITFIVIFMLAYFSSVYFTLNFLILAFFSVFVIEGVIALAGLIALISFTGTDYVSSSSLINC